MKLIPYTLQLVQMKVQVHYSWVIWRKLQWQLSSTGQQLNMEWAFGGELRVQYTTTCVDEGWNSAQYSLVMQLVQIRSN